MQQANRPAPTYTEQGWGNINQDHLKSVLWGLKGHPRTWDRGIEAIRNVPYVDGGGIDHGSTSSDQMPRVVPVLMYVHGGGFTILSKDTHWMVGLLIAQRGFVFSINYRLAPEHRFPAAIEDACTAAAWVHDHAAEYGGDPDQLFLAGESAGANLITGISVANCFERPEPWARQFLNAICKSRLCAAAGILR